MHRKEPDAPEDPHRRAVLEEKQVGRDLLDRAGGETNDDEAAIPSDALERGNNHADRVVHTVCVVLRSAVAHEHLAQGRTHTSTP